MQELVMKNALVKGKRKAAMGQLHQLILTDETAKPLHVLLMSQYAIAMGDPSLQNSTVNAANKSQGSQLPLPLLFAVFPSNPMQFIPPHIKDAEHPHIMLYNLAKTHTQCAKRMFCLEQVLKRDPFFAPAVYDFCRELHNNNRKEQAINILKRHMKGVLGNQILLQLQLLQYLKENNHESNHSENLNNGINTNDQSRIIARIFNGKSLKIQVYFWLAVAIKKKFPQKAFLMFKKIVQIIKKNIFLENEESSQKEVTLISKKYQTLFNRAMIQLGFIYEINKDYTQAVKIFQEVLIDDKMLTKKIEYLRIKKYQDEVNKKNEKIYDQQYVSSQSKLNKRLEINENMRDENKKYILRKQYNEQKLKYLLMKQKQLNGAFKQICNLKIKKQNAKNNCLNAQNQATTRQNLKTSLTNRTTKIYLQSRQTKTGTGFRSQTIKMSQNKTKKNFQTTNFSYESKLQLKPQQFKQFQEYFQGKKKIHQLKLNNGQLQQILNQILSDQNDNNILTTQKTKFLKQIISIDAEQQNIEEQEGHNFEKQFKKYQQLQQQGQVQQALNGYLQMYKEYKNQKQQILLKIGAIFQFQDEYLKAQKTYLKCTKFDNAKAFVSLGNLLMRTGRIKSGVQNIQKANCIQRFDLQIENKLVYGYSLRPQTMQKALILAKTILKKQPQSLQTILLTANILQKQDKVQEAISIIHALDSFKESQYIKHYLGMLYLKQSNIDKAFAFFKEALKIKPKHCPSLIQIATILSQQHQDKSIEILQKVLELQPNNVLALARLGKINESHNIDAAINCYQKTYQIKPQAQTLIKIGDCYEKAGRLTQALDSYTRAVQLKQTHQGRANIARVNEQKKNYDKAFQQYELALKLVSNDELVRRSYLLKLAQMSLISGRNDTTIMCLNQVLQYEQDIQLYKMLAQAYLAKQNYDEALEYLEKASGLAGQRDVEILEKMASCFDCKEEYLASKLIYERIIALEPNNVKAMNNLANICLVAGETNAAFELFEKMLQLKPGDLDKHLQVAEIYAKVGDWSKVQTHLLKCYQINPRDQQVLEKLLRLYKEKRDTRQIGRFEKKIERVKMFHKKK